MVDIYLALLKVVVIKYPLYTKSSSYTTTKSSSYQLLHLVSINAIFS